MSSKYVGIQVKREVRDQLKTAVEKMNGSNISNITVAGLVTMLATAYTEQLTDNIVASNNTGWISNGTPIILNSDGEKHYRELLQYEPVEACFIVSDFIREEAMKRRFAKITGENSNGK